MFNKGKWKNDKRMNTLVTRTNPKSKTAEEFKALRNNIQFAMDNHSAQTLMFTSANRKEGRTTVAANTAVTFANRGKRVLLIDADMRHPSLHLLFETANQAGLSDLLIDPVLRPSAVFQHTQNPNLTLLPSGTLSVDPAELIDSQRMDQLIEHFKKEFQLILFDATDLLSAADAQTLAAKVDGTVFVIRDGVSDKKELLKAKELLKYAKASVLGAVLNDKESKNKNSYVPSV